MLFVLLFTAYKAFGFVKLFSVLFAAGFLAVYSFEFIVFYTFDSLVGGIELGTGTLNTVTEIVFQVFAIALLANLVIALFSTMGKGTAVLDLVRAVVVFVLAVAAYVLLGIYDGFENGFTYIGTIVSVAIALVQFVFALIVLLVLHARKKRGTGGGDRRSPRTARTGVPFRGRREQPDGAARLGRARSSARPRSSARSRRSRLCGRGGSARTTPLRRRRSSALRT